MKLKLGKSWWIWTLLAVTLAIPLTLAVWTVADPSVLDSYNKAKSEQNDINVAMVGIAQYVADKAPAIVRGPVHYQSAEKTLYEIKGFQDSVIYGFNVKVDGARCAQYLGINDNPKQKKVKEVCIYSKKAVKVETSWIKETLDSVSKWPIWEKYGKLYNELGAFGSP